MKPIPRFLLESNSQTDCFYTWGPGCTCPQVPVSRRKRRRVRFVLSDFHAQALCVYGVFGASLTYQTYFQYRTFSSRLQGVETALTSAYAFFLVLTCLCLVQQLFPLTHFSPQLSSGALLVSIGGSVILCMALFVDYSQEGFPWPTIGLGVAIIVGFPVLIIHRWLFGSLASVTKGLLRAVPIGNCTESPHVAITMIAAVKQDHEDERAAAAFFLVSYSLHRGALDFLEKEVPAFSQATLENRSGMLLELYNVLFPGGMWTVFNSTSDARTLCLRFLELSERWSSVIHKMGIVDPGSIKDEGIAYVPPDTLVQRLLGLEKILNFDESAPSHASPMASGSDTDGADPLGPSASRHADEAQEEGAATAAPSASELDSERGPAAPPSEDRPASLSSEDPQHPPSSPRTSAYCARCSLELSAGSLNRSSAALGCEPPADAGGEDASSGNPSGSRAKVLDQASGHAVTEASGGPDIAVAVSSVVKDDGLTSPAPVSPGQPVQTPDSASGRGT